MRAHVPARQRELPLGPVDVPEPLLRAAFERLRARVTFEEAMQWSHFRIVLRHTALAIARRRR